MVTSRSSPQTQAKSRQRRPSTHRSLRRKTSETKTSSPSHGRRSNPRRAARRKVDPDEHRSRPEEAQAVQEAAEHLPEVGETGLLCDGVSKPTDALGDTEEDEHRDIQEDVCAGRRHHQALYAALTSVCKKALVKVLFQVWTEDLQINISDDPLLLEAYESKFDAAALESKYNIIDKKVKDVLGGLLEGVSNIGEAELGGLKAIFGQGKTLPKNFFFEFEMHRITYHSNLVINR